MRIRRMELFRRLFDHSDRNEQFELVMTVRGSQEQLAEITKFVAVNCCGTAKNPLAS